MAKYLDNVTVRKVIYVRVNSSIWLLAKRREKRAISQQHCCYLWRCWSPPD
ncbi:hypothetical protein KCP78_01875 [Salmonella enterica subsp. enterica]|nr:hypothetical protein KCP78_01875 [Salmonella enterica subsp. enterica]